MSASPLVATAKAFYAALEVADIDRAASFLTPEYEHAFLPVSAGMGPNLDREAFLARFGALRAIINGLRVTILETWPNDAARTVTILATNEPLFKDEVKQPEDAEDEWTFSGEYLFVLTMDESGEKLVKSIEFVDSAAAQNLQVQIPKAFGRVAPAP